jgi:adenine-specific DNA-methyltransferase
MATINDLISRIQDPDLRMRIEKEVKDLTKQKKFGLVFEKHEPEMTLLYDYPISRGCKVIRKSDDDKKISEDILWEVKKITKRTASCVHTTSNEELIIPVSDLICVAKNGEPIYPCLKLVDSVQKATDTDLWHTLIEADNYHALQLLSYLYPGMVDCIYIDPPYNSGATDWKYNNNYVDGNDSYRHSKWLAMIESRLLLAKKLLNPNNSVLIVTIDEKEYLHIGCLLEDMFTEA